MRLDPEQMSKFAPFMNQDGTFEDGGVDALREAGIYTEDEKFGDFVDAEESFDLPIGLMQRHEELAAGNGMELNEWIILCLKRAAETH